MDAQKVEEALSIVWEADEKNEKGFSNIKEKIEKETGTDIFKNLFEANLIAEAKGEIKLTTSGFEKARDVVRRQRIAERLLVDVLEIGKSEAFGPACEFEHVISTEVEASICTLLGHPRVCPHGSPIPEGKCCIKAKATLGSVVGSLDNLEPGRKGRIVYLLTQNNPQMHKLMSLGIVPGTVIVLHQNQPSFIISVGETQLALERAVAKNIFVRLFV
jgi:DtxR family Mn-dependent transcriptional regulator